MGRIVRTILCMLLLGTFAFGHHSFTAEFDQKKPIKLTGKVTEMKWSNPHGWIYIDVTGTDGKPATARLPRTFPVSRSPTANGSSPVRRTPKLNNNEETVGAVYDRASTSG